MNKKTNPGAIPASDAPPASAQEPAGRIKGRACAISPQAAYGTDLEMLGDYFQLIELRKYIICHDADKCQEKLAAIAVLEHHIEAGIRKAHPKGDAAYLLAKVKILKLTVQERLLIACYCYAEAKGINRTTFYDDIEIVCQGDRVKIIEFRAFLAGKSKLFESGVLRVKVEPSPFRSAESIELDPEITRRLWGPETFSAMAAPAIKTSKTAKIPAINSPRDIHQAISRYVIGQEEAKRTLAVAVYNHHLRTSGKTNITKANIMMAGPTGCGKTYLVEVISKALDVPFVIADASQYSETGYVGRDIGEVLSDLLRAAGNDPERAARGIIFIDEIDKIAASYDSGKHRSTRDVSGEAVQAEMLKLIEGGATNGAPFDASNVLFMAGGAFSGIINRKPDAQGKAAMGFGSRAPSSTAAKPNGPGLDDFINFGMLPELMGRFQVRVVLDSLDQASLRRIMTEPENAVIKQYQRLFKINGIALEVSDEALDLMARQAAAMNTGARALKSVAEGVLSPLMFEHFGGGKKRLVVDRAMVEAVA